MAGGRSQFLEEMGGSDGQAGKAPLSAVEIGGSFVLQYYRTLTTDKDNLHKYYKDESIASRGTEGASPDEITYTAGVEEIREDIQASAHLGASRTEINCIQSLESKQGGIMVLVLGYFVYTDSAKVHFSQVFFLDKQTDPYPGYFVLNDILRYVSGSPEHSELQAHVQTDLPPPLLPPPQPPVLLAPKGAPEQYMVEVAAPELVAAPLKEAAPAEEAAVEEEEDVAEEEEDVEPVHDADADAAAAAAAVDAAEAAEAAEVALAAEAAEAAAHLETEIPEEKPEPRSWASMAGKLKEGGGQLGPSKVLGFGARPQGAVPPAAASGKAAASSTTPVLPPPSTVTKAITPVLPPPTSAAKAKAKAAAAGEDVGDVRLWISRIPTEPVVENQELLECLNKLIDGAGMLGNCDIDRKDLAKEWGYVSISSQIVADLLIQHSKDQKVVVRGKRLKLAVEEKQKSTSNNNRRREGNSGGGKGGDEGGESKAADAGRGPRRGKGAKGDGDRGGKGSKGGADAGSPSDRSAGRGGARRGGDKGGGDKGGSWRESGKS